MSIVAQVERINENIANTYNVLESAGATMPAEANSDNLASTAQSISAVLYGKNQSLTETQKAQARNNIGVVDEIYVGNGDMPDGATIQILMDGSDEEEALKDDLKGYINGEIDVLKESFVTHQDISGKVDKSSALTITGVDANGNTHTWTLYGVKQ